MNSDFFPLPDGAKTWPEGLREPVPHGEAIKAEGSKDGHYYSKWPGGGLRVFGLVEDEQLLEWIYIDEKQQSGYARSDMWPWCAQYYYANNTIEEFNMYDDCSKPYEAEMSFGDWVREQVAAMLKWKPKTRLQRAIEWVQMRLFPPRKRL
jgi:hypothetical protein